MLRTITLSLLMLVIGRVMLPFANSTAHGIRQSSASRSQKRQYRRHSRAWWRRYRARLRRRRAAALRIAANAAGAIVPQTATATGKPNCHQLTTNLPAGLERDCTGEQ